MSLIGIIQAVQDTVGAIEGIRVAPDYAPENLNGIFPFAVCFPRAGEYTSGPGFSTYEAFHNLQLQLHFSRTDLPKSLQVAIPYGDLISKALLADPTIDGSCQTFDNVTYAFGPLVWGDVETIGWDFTINRIKEGGSTT